MNVLIVEDNDLIRDGLEYYLSNEGFNVKSYANLIDDNDNLVDIDIAVLDISLNDGSGFDLCKTIKDKLNIPVIFLTARDSDVDIETGLTLADDYIIKPFRNRELLLRINNLINRGCTSNIIKIGNIIIDNLKCEVLSNDKVINLTTLEYKLFYLLVKNKNQVLETDYLLDFIYSLTGNYVEDNTLRVYIKRIREKLGEDIIKNIKGVGYKIND